MNKLRMLPAIDSLQQDKRFNAIEKSSQLSDLLLTEWLKEIIDQLRQQLLAKQEVIDVADEEALFAYIFTELQNRVTHFTERKELQDVINATGVVIHTNLGRSRLSEPALTHMIDTAKSYATLEYDVSSGTRGSRHTIVERYLTELTGAEAAIVVNNNAAAVYLVLKALAAEKEVIVSRGELVEIGGSFRISEIMALSEATLVEIGTTNKTKLADYEAAITDETGMILKVHKSNFALIGFTEDVPTDDLVTLTKERELPLYEDLGSGTLFDFTSEGIGREPTVQAQVKKGIDLISFSGDKLLGGPQAGIIVGKKAYIDKLKQHQLARVLRVDKFTLASLEATLKTYIAGKEKETIPTVRDIVASKEDIKEKALKVKKAVQESNTTLQASLVEGVSKVGGGTMPEVDLPTFIVELTCEKRTSHELARRLRKNRVPIIVRVKDETVQVDVRTVTEEEIEVLIEALIAL